MMARLIVAVMAVLAAAGLSGATAADVALAPMARTLEAARGFSSVIQAQARRRRSRSVATRRTAPDDSETPAGQATSNGEVLFGALSVGFLVDRDIIPVGPEIGKFERVRLRVLRNDIYISDLTAVYEDGKTDTLLQDTQISSNRKTAWIPLQHSGFIKEFRLVYRSRPSYKGRARVEVFGEYTDGWLGPDGEGRRYNDGWVLLGTDTAGSIGFDRVKIPVGRNEGGFRQLRVSVKDRDITMKRLAVVYADGTKDDIETDRMRIAADVGYGPVDLEQDGAIKEIQAIWRSRAFATSKRTRAYATVQVWGKH